MKKGIKKIFSAVTAFVTLSITCISTQENNITLSANAVNGSGNGIKDGYYWELWTPDDKGTAEMKVGDNGSYIANWDGINDYFAVACKKWEDNRLDWSEIGEIKIQYDVDYKSEGNSSIGATGFTSDLMVEFFIIEDWEEWSLPSSYKALGEITVDAHIYDVYKMGRAITMNGISESLDRYFSVRREGDTSTSGTINVTKHFEEWGKLGMELGRELIEVGFCVQAFQSSGSVDVKSNIMTIDGVPINNEEPSDPDLTYDNGIYDGYNWEVWSGTHQGYGKIIPKSNGSFSCNWKEAEEASFSVGKIFSFNDSPSIETLGEIEVNYNAENFYADGNTYIGTNIITLYDDKLIMFHIIDKFYGKTPVYGDLIGSIEDIYGKYDVYKFIQTHNGDIGSGGYGSPAYRIIRTENPVSKTNIRGGINATSLFEQLKKLGTETGEELLSIVVNVEIESSSGYADISECSITFDEVDIKNLDSNDITTTTTPSTTTIPEITTTTTVPSTTTVPEVTTTTTASSTTSAPEVTTTTTEPNAITLAGDANCDGGVDVADIVLVKCYLINAESYSMTKQGTANADIQGESNGINVQDVVAMQKYVLKLIEELPVV